ncbi:nuclear transport factor 2 family protein [Mucilaginibacter sp. FT3.2]|uniref:nuclear transport factor 2 family protein n=1 Tax=Mucilaginibacter sp. FT3.2 TaxID=2723090 RepID=UPI0016149DA4|nr:nuclear transport factor 2 family protein [Mucilaginibacter sp. FT3.2]MBB6235000.1 putative hydrolase of HD superfamily [Mucilaginibacter sp. FT3.2]
MDNASQIAMQQVVQKQLDAYNARDIDLFMTYWADDAQYYLFPDTLLATGAAAIRERHIVRFEEPDLFGKLTSRTVLGNRVVDVEVVSRTFPNGPGHIDAVCIYELANDKITKAWFVMGEPVLQQG